MTRRLFALAFVCLVALGATPPAPDSSTSYGFYCQRVINDETCVWVCCDDIGCYESPC